MEKNNTIVETMQRRFQQICEYVTMGNGIVEADDDNNASEPQGEEQGMPPMGGGAPDMGGQGQSQAPEGLNPQGGDMGDQGSMPPMDGGMAPDMGGQQMGPDDQEIDITELTDSIEGAEEGVAEMDEKFGKVMKMIGGLEELLRQNDNKINDLKTEFEKRNPTQIEKLSMQTAKSYPFNVTPESYWDEKEATSNYRTEDDENGKKQGQYTITDKDLNGAVNWREIADSLTDDDFVYNQTLKGAMGI